MTASKPQQVAITAEPEPHGYGQHMITVERGNAGSVQCMILTDLEMVQLAAVLESYQGVLATVGVKFSDHSGRSPVVQEEHGRFGVVS